MRQFSAQSIMITFIYLNVTDPLITKNLVIKIQNLVVNHESAPAMSNPEYKNNKKNT